MALAAGVVLVLVGRPADPGPAAVASTSPADGATLAGAPDDVELSFTGRVDPGRSHISILGSARAAGALRQTAPERLSRPIATPAGGEVTVAYHVPLTDGAEPGRFAALHGRRAGAGETSDPAPAHAHGIDPVSAVLLVADGVAVLTVGVLLMRRPRPRGGR